MKFGIITLVSDNYGNKFQNYAVEQLLSEYGDVQTFELENLNQKPNSAQKSFFSKLSFKYICEVLRSRLMYTYDINRVDKNLLYNLFYVLFNSKKLSKLITDRSNQFKNFSNSYLHICENKLNFKNVGADFVNQFDYFICGSDQIWNPTYVTTSELAFCSFAPQKTICMSPSFGVSQIPDYRKAEYARLLKNIYKLSVREKDGQKIIKDLVERDAPVLLDPTMLLPIEKWNELSKQPKTELPKKYVVCYFLGKIDKAYKKAIEDFAKQKDLAVVMLFDITAPQYYTFAPDEVLYVIKNAQYVLTDSFHGSVFSILFHKNFYVFSRNEGGSSMNSRLDTLLEKFDLNDRTNLNSNDITKKQWQNVESVLLKEKDIAKEYLINAQENKCELSPNNYNTYAGYICDSNKLLKSASGGVATALSEAIIKKGGCVFGVSYSKDFKSAEYVCCDSTEQLDCLKGSKYVETNKNFKNIENKLKNGKTVLFFGLGCDVAAVKSYCKSRNIDTENLFTVDILCHGPLDKLIHKKYIEDLEKTYKSKVIDFKSRSKKYGWSSSSYMRVVFENGKVFEKPFESTDYGYVFTHYALNKCTNCQFKGFNHQGDLCVGDFWGVRSSDSCYNKNGVSIIIEQSKKGRLLLELLSDDFKLEKAEFIYALSSNPMYFYSRNSQCDYKQLLNKVTNSTLHTALKNDVCYKKWKTNTQIIKFKTFIYKIIN